MSRSHASDLDRRTVHDVPRSRQHGAVHGAVDFTTSSRPSSRSALWSRLAEVAWRGVQHAPDDLVVDAETPGKHNA